VDAGIATCKFRRLSLTIRRAAWSGLATSLGNEGEESCRTNKCGMGRMALHYWASDTSTAPIGQSELLLTLRLGICCVQTALCIRICIQYVSMFGCGCIDIYVCLNRARPGYQTSKTQVEVYVDDVDDVDGQQASRAKIQHLGLGSRNDRTEGERRTSHQYQQRDCVCLSHCTPGRISSSSYIVSGFPSYCFFSKNSDHQR
jgi:hypothetical protein